MTEPGWDIPGVPRDAPADGSPAGAGTDAGPRRAARRAHPVVSASARAGFSAGAFPPGTAPAGTVQAGASAAGDCSASGCSGPGDSCRGDSVRGDSVLGESVPGDSAPGDSGPGGPRPDGPARALEFLSAALDYLARADAADWTAGQQADCLRALAVAESRQAAVHAKTLAAFSVPGGGLAGDGHGSPRMWLTWQTRATRRAAANQVSWMRRQQAHPRTAAALAGGQISLSWARQLTDWSDLLPEDARDTADRLLLDAAGTGSPLSELSQIAEELLRRHAPAGGDGDDGFEDRNLRLAKTFGGAGRLDGDLTARCAAAAGAVLDSLSARRGPEDTRTLGQRQHDGFEEACIRLLGADCLPERAGQPVRLDLQISLDELAADGAGSPGGPGVTCDATIQTTITGHLDHDLLATLAAAGYPGKLAAAADRARDDQFSIILQQAIALLSGPSGRAAALRRGLTGIPAGQVSLPLDIAGTTDTIPVHLRRAVRLRDQHCRFPGCDLPPAACDVHHIQHRKDGGRHALTNLVLQCHFHHLVAIHRWGWQFTLHPDGTTTATSPDGTKTLHSHSPPARAA